MGPPESAVECGIAHICRAKWIRLNDLRRLRRSLYAVQNWTELLEIGYIGSPHDRSIDWTRVLENAPRGARLHHDRLG
jgi:hypothetical protein